MRALFLLMLGLFVAVAALSLSVRADEKPADGPVPALSSANNAFGMDMLRRLHEDGKNTFMSPTSIGMALQMTSIGARGETLNEMRTVMQLGEIDTGKANRELLSALSGREAVTLRVANSIWADPDRIQLNRAFADELQRQFDARIDAVSFADPATVAVINRWVADRTEQKIPKLFERLERDTVAVLVNAIYFKGDWTDPFEKEQTKDAEFTLANGEKISVKMMNRRGSYRYTENEEAQIVALPYGKDKQMSMWVVLPRQGKSLDSVVKGLTTEKLSEWQKAAGSQTVVLGLPRFKMKFRKELKHDLAEMGMPTLFSDRADLSGLEEGSGRNLYVSQVIHEAIIEVNEEGTVAAAATGVAIGRTSVPRHYVMTCDRPFFLAIQDDRTGSILFMGTVYKPEKLD
jgi:serine protease inhibitor